MIKIHYNNVDGMKITHETGRVGELEIWCSHTFEWSKRKISNVTGFDEFLLEMMQVKSFSGTIDGQKLVTTNPEEINITLDEELEIYAKYIENSEDFENTLVNGLYKMVVEDVERQGRLLFLMKMKEIL